jgi:hypothetical protein
MTEGLEPGGDATRGYPLHSASVIAMDWCEQSDDFLTASTDGKIAVVRADAKFTGWADLHPLTISEASPWDSISDACWLRPKEIVSVGGVSGIKVWDIRTRGGCVRSSSAGSGVRAESVAALPAAPHACAVGHGLKPGQWGDKNASLSRWDLRMMRAEESVNLGEAGAAGSVRVRLDARREGTAVVPLVATTSGGQLMEVDLGNGGGAQVEMVAEVEGALRDISVDRVNGAVMYASTDLQSLVVVDRRKRSSSPAIQPRFRGIDAI